MSDKGNALEREAAMYARSYDEMRAEVERLRELEEAEEAIRRLAELASFFHVETDDERDDFENPDCERGRPGHWKIDVDPATNNGYPRRDPFSEASLVFDLPAVRRAIGGAG